MNLNNSATIRKPKISVVMAGLNCEKFVRWSVESILQQTLSELELIFINDGSTDKTGEIVKSYANQDRRVRLLERENRGLAASLNEAISIARAPWIARMDADDISLSHRLERQLEYAKMMNADVCGGWTSSFGTISRRTRRYPSDDDAIKLLLCFRTAFSHPTVVMKTKLAQRIPYNAHLMRAQDYDLWTRMAVAGVYMCNIPEVVLRYRTHGNQTSHLHAADQGSSREIFQKRYLSEIGASNLLKALAPRFSTPNSKPTQAEARQLVAEVKRIRWASDFAKLKILALVLRYVQPASVDTFHLANQIRKDLQIDRSPELTALFVQGVIGASPSSKIYRIIKRFV